MRIPREDVVVFFFQAEDGIRDYKVTGVQTCALPILQAFPFCSFKQAATRAAVDFRFYRLLQRARHPKIVSKQTSSIAQSEVLLQMREQIGRASCRERV